MQAANHTGLLYVYAQTQYKTALSQAHTFLRHGPLLRDPLYHQTINLNKVSSEVKALLILATFRICSLNIAQKSFLRVPPPGPGNFRTWSLNAPRIGDKIDTTKKGAT